MAELREQTAELHTRAERHPIQAALVRGQADRAVYASYLSQSLHLHAALEGELHLRAGSPTLAPVLPEQYRAGRAGEDLAFLGVGMPDGPVAAVQDLAAGLGRASDAELLGMQYVLEGSTNGGRFIAAAVRRALALEGAEGTRYLDPYGESQPARWGSFCAAMGRLSLSPEARRAAVGGARRMFGVIIDMFDQIAAAQPAKG
jgi:heme oxygenase